MIITQLQPLSPIHACQLDRKDLLQLTSNFQRNNGQMTYLYIFSLGRCPLGKNIFKVQVYFITLLEEEEEEKKIKKRRSLNKPFPNVHLKSIWEYIAYLVFC